jgi:phage shock protein PspC (stress-responsive transcriptional regulator)/predicted membrane protein
MVAGVCSGLGRYFDLNPSFFRVAFVVLTLLGGSGLLIYGAAVLVVPDEGAEESIAGRVLKQNREKPWAMVGLALVAVASLLLLQSFRFHPAGNGILVLLLAVGALLLWAHARDERTGRRRALRFVGGLLVLLVVAALAFIGIALATLDIHLSKGIGDRTYVVTSPDELQRKYELGIGQLELDLSRLRLRAPETSVTAHVGTGELRVVVPPDVTVRYSVDAKWGQVHAFDDEIEGHHARSSGTSTASSSRLLVLKATVGAGQVDVERGLR